MPSVLILRDSYWKFPHDVVLRPQCGSHAPVFIKENLGNSGLAVTKDFRHFRRLGRITESALDDRDAILFPEKVNGKYVLLHRPKQYTGVSIMLNIRLFG